MTNFDFDVLVIGSGFGGSVSALRLTEKGERLAATVADAVLEQLSLMRTVLAELTTVIDLVDRELDSWEAEDASSRRLGRVRPAPPTR